MSRDAIPLHHESHPQPLRHWWSLGIEYHHWLPFPLGNAGPFVEFFQMHRRFGTDDLFFPVYPHGHLCVSVNFQIGHSGVYLFGLNNTTWQAPLTKGELVFGGTFTLGTVNTVLGIPAAELCDQVIEFHDIWPAESRRLIDHIGEASTIVERARILQSFFHRFSLEKKRAPALLPHAIKSIYNSPTLPIHHIADHHGISRRQLSRIFKEHVGITPKTLARFFRLANARKILHANPKVDLADLCHMLGYYDQAHFNKEFRQCHDATPTRYISTLLEGEPSPNETVAHQELPLTDFDRNALPPAGIAPV